jgi:predicted lysophospholipase L1 biosynthesis ABC-type transport system permease subunit
MMKNILAIQSHVVYGHAGNSAAEFPMRRLGANVWPLKFYLPIVTVVVVLLLAGLMGGSMLLWAVLAG